MLLRVSRITGDLQIAELDLNPVIAWPDGAGPRRPGPRPGG
jgi:hypothetical protein